MPDFENIHILVVGVAVDQQRGLQLVGVRKRRPAQVFLDVFANVLAEVIRRCVQLAVAIRFVTHARHQVAHRDACIRHRVSLRMLEYVHQGDQAAMAPSHDTDPFRVQEIVLAQHPLATQKNIVHFTPAVIDLLIEAASIAGAASIIR